MDTALLVRDADSDCIVAIVVIAMGLQAILFSLWT